MIKNIFLAGAYTGIDKNKLSIYAELKQFILGIDKNFNIVNVDDVDNYKKDYQVNHPNASFKDVEIAMVKYDIDFVKNCDLIIANLTNKSIGVGIELGIAFELNKNVLFVAESGSTISNMVLGCFQNNEIHFYKDLVELKNIVKNYLEGKIK